MTFGQKIKHLRTKANLTQKELAEKMNVTFQTISKWESDINEPDIESIRRLSNIFGCSIEYLFSQEEEEEKIQPKEEEKTEEIPKEEKKEEIAPVPVAETETTPEPVKEEKPKEEEEEDTLLKSEGKILKPTSVPTKSHFMARDDHKVLIWSIVVAVACFIISLVCFIVYRQYISIPWIVIGPILIAYIALADVYCIFTDTYISEIFITIATKSIHFPGLIFTWSLDGFAWLIGMKILFAILGFLASIAIVGFALFLSSILAIVSFIPIVIKNSI